MSTLTLALTVSILILLHSLSWLYMQRVRAKRRQKITQVLLKEDKEN